MFKSEDFSFTTRKHNKCDVLLQENSEKASFFVGKHWKFIKFPNSSYIISQISYICKFCSYENGILFLNVFQHFSEYKLQEKRLNGFINLYFVFYYVYSKLQGKTNATSNRYTWFVHFLMFSNVIFECSRIQFAWPSDGPCSKSRKYTRMSM